MELAKLFVLGMERELLWVEVAYLRETDKKGKPTSEVLGGQITATFHAQRDDDRILRWMSKPCEDGSWEERDKMEAGKICFYEDGFDRPSTKQWKFNDGLLVYYEEVFDTLVGPSVWEGPGILGEGSMKVVVKISAAVQEYGTMLLKQWKVSCPPPGDPSPRLPAATVPELLSVDWTDEHGSPLAKARYGQEVALTVGVRAGDAGQVRVHVAKRDGSDLEEGSDELVFTAPARDGQTELARFKVKEAWEAHKSAEVDELVATARYAGRQRQSGPLPIVPTPKVLVNFRTGNNYKGEYGFDWIRMGDTGKPGDVWYKDIIGSYKTGSFVQSDAAYAKLGRLFEMPNHPIKANDRYVVPVLALLPDQKATLTLKVEVEGCDAKKIEYKYDAAHFKLNTAEVSHKTVGKATLADGLTIECIKEFGTDQFIEVEADGKFAGKLKIMANDRAHRYKADIVFVKVKVNIGNGIKTGGTTGESRFLKRYLHQAFVKPNIIEKELDLTADSILNSTYTLVVGTDVYINDIPGIHGHVRAEFDKVHPGHNNYFKVFLFGEAGGELLTNSSGNQYYQGYNGAAESINSKAVVLYNTHNTSTTTHEVLHAMGLYHSFSDRGRFTLEKNKTDNIMDYSHNVGINRIATWLWQWMTIQANPNVLKE